MTWKSGDRGAPSAPSTGPRCWRSNGGRRPPGRCRPRGRTAPATAAGRRSRFPSVGGRSKSSRGATSVGADASSADRAQAAQTQETPRSASGMRARSSALNEVVAHQHGSSRRPLARARRHSRRRRAGRRRSGRRRPSASSAGALACRDLDLDLHARIGEARRNHHRGRAHGAEVLAQHGPARPGIRRRRGARR